MRKHLRTKTNVWVSSILMMIVFAGGFACFPDSKVQNERLEELLAAFPGIGWCKEGTVGRATLYSDSVTLHGLDFTREHTNDPIEVVAGKYRTSSTFIRSPWFLSVYAVGPTADAEKLSVFFVAVGRQDYHKYDGPSAVQTLKLTSDIALGETRLTQVQRLLPVPSRTEEREDGRIIVHFELQEERRVRKLRMQFNADGILEHVTLVFLDPAEFVDPTVILREDYQE